MIKRCSPLSSTALALLITLLCVCLSVAKSEQAALQTPAYDAVSDDSVLHLIPEKTLGVIYCANPLKLDNSINALFADLSLQSGSPEILAEILASTLGANFESSADFQAVGLDLSRDFALFFTSLEPLHLSAAIQLKDTEKMKQVIAAETAGNAPVEYKGVTYWNTNGGGSCFAILDNILVYSRQRTVCEAAIDTRKGTRQAITENPNYQSFLTDLLKNTDQLGVCFDIEGIAASPDSSLEEVWKSMIDPLSDSVLLSWLITPLLKNVSAEQIAFVAQLRSVNAKLQVEGTDVQITPSIAFKKDSELINVVREVSAELTHLGELPNRATLNAAFQGSSTLLTEISTSWLDFTPQDIRAKQQKGEQLLDPVKGFYESLADRWSISMSFGDGVLPNHLFIYELKDEQHAKAYMDERFLGELNFKTASTGPSTIHNGVEIRSYIFPNLKKTFTETELLTLEQPLDLDLVPPEWHWYYAFSDGALFFATGTNPQLIQAALDRRAGKGEKFSEHPRYQELRERLGADSNVLLAVSPMTAFKSMLLLMEQTEPESLLLMQMYSGMLMNLPENYSIGFAAKAREGRIDGKLLLTLGDFKPLIQAVHMMIGM